MFSNNQVISLRQIRRLLILDLFGLSSLLLPGILSDIAAGDGIFCILAGTLLAFIYLWILKMLINRMEKDYYSYMKKTTGIVFSDICMIFYSFFFILVSAFVIYQLTGLVRAWLLPEGSYRVICFLILLFAAYATVRGIEGKARIYEILFWIVVLPLLVMLIFASKEVNPNYWTPVFHTAWPTFIDGSVIVFTFLLPMIFILFLKPFCSQPKKIFKSASAALIMVAVINMASYLILIGTFQSKTTHVLSRPIITLMSMVTFPGGFLARLDAIMTAVWFVSLFALLNTSISYGSHILRDLFSEKKTHFCLGLTLIGVFLACILFFEQPLAVDFFYSYIRFAAMPVVILLPILFLLIGGIRNKNDRRKGEDNAINHE